MKITSLIILTLLFHLPAFAETPAFRMNSGAPESLANAARTGFYDQITIEIFKRLDIKLNYTHLPNKRSLLNANSGIDDGLISRIKGMEKKWPNIIRVPESVMTWEFTAFSMDKDIKITGWESLKPYTVGHIRGWQIYKKNAVSAKKIIEANNASQLFELLKSGRIELALFERFQSPYWFNKIGYTAKALSAPLAVKPLYIYLHKRHKDLVPKMAKVISEIKQDGTYQKIFDRTLNFKK